MNTGACAGMGVDILHTIAAMADPTHAVQFVCAAGRPSHQMAPFTPDLYQAVYSRYGNVVGGDLFLLLIFI